MEVFRDNLGRILERYGSGANRALDDFLRAGGRNSGIYWYPRTGGHEEDPKVGTWGIRVIVGPDQVFDETWILRPSPPGKTGTRGWTRGEVETWKTARLTYWQAHAGPYEKTGLKPLAGEVLKHLENVGIVPVQAALDFTKPPPEPQTTEEPVVKPTKKAKKKKNGRRRKAKAPPGTHVGRGCRYFEAGGKKKDPHFEVVVNRRGSDPPWSKRVRVDASIDEPGILERLQKIRAGLLAEYKAFAASQGAPAAPEEPQGTPRTRTKKKDPKPPLSVVGLIAEALDRLTAELARNRAAERWSALLAVGMLCAVMEPDPDGTTRGGKDGRKIQERALELAALFRKKTDRG